VPRTLQRLLGLATLSGALACSFIVDTDEISSGCASGTKYCDGRCVDVKDASYGCTLKGCAPCQQTESGDFFSDRYVPECSGDQCVVSRCAGDYGCAECDRHLLTDEAHCGACMHACTSVQTCSVGSCVPLDAAGGTGGAGAQSDAQAQQRNPTP
jgi:hypothetical protein